MQRLRCRYVDRIDVCEFHHPLSKLFPSLAVLCRMIRVSIIMYLILIPMSQSVMSI